MRWFMFVLGVSAPFAEAISGGYPVVVNFDEVVERHQTQYTTFYDKTETYPLELKNKDGSIIPYVMDGVYVRQLKYSHVYPIWYRGGKSVMYSGSPAIISTATDNAIVVGAANGAPFQLSGMLLSANYATKDASGNLVPSPFRFEAWGYKGRCPAFTSLKYAPQPDVKTETMTYSPSSVRDKVGVDFDPIAWSGLSCAMLPNKVVSYSESKYVYQLDDVNVILFQ